MEEVMSIERIEVSSGSLRTIKTEGSTSKNDLSDYVSYAKDTNHDGFVSLDEAKQEPTMKDTRDLNNDGVISQREVIIRAVTQQAFATTTIDDAKITADQLSAQLMGLSDGAPQIPPEQLMPSLSQLGLSQPTGGALLDKLLNDKDLSVVA